MRDSAGLVKPDYIVVRFVGGAAVVWVRLLDASVISASSTVLTAAVVQHMWKRFCCTVDVDGWRGPKPLTMQLVIVAGPAILRFSVLLCWVRSQLASAGLHSTG
jgi:hypothetical protein